MLLKNIYNVDTIIVDECSMISQQVFDSVNNVCKIKDPSRDFGVYSQRLNTDIAVREQYPLKPAFGRTIHKAQGMTLNRAEVDCRDIFRPGHLGVAMSRVTTSAGLRVINYHPRYIIPPPQTVKDFVNEASQPAFPDLTCCRNSHSKSEDAAPLSFEQVDDSSAQSADIEDIDCENGDDDFDEEFNTVIATIISDEAESVEFEIPEGFDIDSVMQSMLYKKEVTDTHVCINRIIHEVDSHRLITFVKKLFLKLASYITKLTGNKSISNGIPEKNIVSFYRLVHEFSTSAEYRMSCFMLFHGEDFTDNHMIVCYNLIEAVRLFYLKQKVDLLKISSSFITKRRVTDASRARVRYVAGYCLASLRKKFIKIQTSNLCSTSKVGQDMYIEAKWINYILNILREDEHYLKAHTEEPDSLLDIERKQYASRGLINFRKDIKSAYRVEKTMAHRKQIKVTTQKQTAGESSSNKCKNVNKTSVVHNVPKETDSSDAIVAEPGPSLEPQASMSDEPEPGPSGLQAGSSDTEDTTDLCHFCFIDKDDEWIQCDSCNNWYHRKCLKIKSLMFSIKRI
ncbi:uncharacterized protein LOC132749678 [Ruditapes philippinarum]|uniref:uncharacterized protein LOC132749678 n=1 Tax=Ruditapes philippinarum TaxID=129788 RepID=UPI00295B9BC5|nr:uncharacterized protein LOC132749678 [Ruditapes philippinarum]